MSYDVSMIILTAGVSALLLLRVEFTVVNYENSTLNIFTEYTRCGKTLACSYFYYTDRWVYNDMLTLESASREPSKRII